MEKKRRRGIERDREEEKLSGRERREKWWGGEGSRSGEGGGKLKGGQDWEEDVGLKQETLVPVQNITLFFTITYIMWSL